MPSNGKSSIQKSYREESKLRQKPACPDAAIFDGLLTSFELTFKQGYVRPKGY
jgi:hypothetical protein